MAGTEREFRSQFPVSEGLFDVRQEIDLGETPAGVVVKQVGRRGKDIEVHYRYRGDLSGEIEGFPYMQDGISCFEISRIVANRRQGGPKNVSLMGQLFRVLERDCAARGVEVLTTACVPQLVNVVCKRYGFRPSSDADRRAIAGYDRHSRYQGFAVSLQKRI